MSPTRMTLAEASPRASGTSSSTIGKGLHDVSVSRSACDHRQDVKHLVTGQEFRLKPVSTNQSQLVRCAAPITELIREYCLRETPCAAA
ncbi:hypothetical protein QF011_000247 [Curtobacterium flaccumfaciens]|nr:hypothetical protein [Curtobacterium flaccumfaciens]